MKVAGLPLLLLASDAGVIAENGPDSDVVERA
jgi:hypothetical protein